MPETNTEADEVAESDFLAGDRRAEVVPRCRTLSGFAVEAGSTKGIAIQSLEPGTTLIVRTSNTYYRLVVLKGSRHRVLVAGGALLPVAVPADLQGSSAGGSVMKMGWIGVGLRLELCIGAHRIITSPVRSITIEMPSRCTG